MSEWQPINSAPKDGTEVLLFVPDSGRGIYIGHFVDAAEVQYGKTVRERKYWYIGMQAFGGHDSEPSHWMHVPKAPYST